MHKVLERQIKKFVGDGAIPKNLAKLFDEISKTYEHFDEDRVLVERSLEISSKELNELNGKLKQELAAAQFNSEELKKTLSLLDAAINSTEDGILVVDN